MGLLDKLKDAKGRVFSPTKVWLAGHGSDDVVRAGGTATVVVEVSGEDDGTVTQIDLALKQSGHTLDTPVLHPLGQVPTTTGLHRIEVTIPQDLPPSCLGFVDYAFRADLQRSKGIGSTADVRVDVIALPQHLWWPDGPRSGSAGADDVRITVLLDADTAAIGGAVSGRVEVRGATSGDVTLELGTEIDTTVRVPGRNEYQPRVRYKALASQPLGTLTAGGPQAFPFRVEVPEGTLPTLHNGGKTSVVWQVRGVVGKAVGWSLVGVLDPDSKARTREDPHSSTAAFLDMFL